MQERYNGNDIKILTITRDEKIVSAISYKENKNESTIYISLLASNPKKEYKNAGIQALKQVAKISHEKGYDHIYLISKTNTQEYYEKIGFTHVNQLCVLDGQKLIDFIKEE